MFVIAKDESLCKLNMAFLVLICIITESVVEIELTTISLDFERAFDTEKTFSTEHVLKGEIKIVVLFLGSMKRGNFPKFASISTQMYLNIKEV